MMRLLKSLFDKNLITINHKPNNNFNNHIVYGGTQEGFFFFFF
jgi:hypothetical protein